MQIFPRKIQSWSLFPVINHSICAPREIFRDREILPSLLFIHVKWHSNRRSGAVKSIDTNLAPRPLFQFVIFNFTLISRCFWHCQFTRKRSLRSHHIPVALHRHEMERFGRKKILFFRTWFVSHRKSTAIPRRPQVANPALIHKEVPTAISKTSTDS